MGLAAPGASEVPQPVPQGLEKPQSPFPDLCLQAAVAERLIAWKIVANIL